MVGTILPSSSKNIFLFTYYLSTLIITITSRPGSSTGQSPVLNLSKSNCEASGSEAGGTGPEDEDEEDEAGESDQDDVSDKEQGVLFLISLFRI